MDNLMQDELAITEEQIEEYLKVPANLPGSSGKANLPILPDRNSN
jgi:hypothetical protein